MRYTKNAITQLKRQYRSVLLKCAMINAALLMATSVASAKIYQPDYETNPWFGPVYIDGEEGYGYSEGVNIPEQSDYWVMPPHFNSAVFDVNSLMNFSTFTNETAGSTVNAADHLDNMGSFINNGSVNTPLLNNNGTFTNKGTVAITAAERMEPTKTDAIDLEPEIIEIGDLPMNINLYNNGTFYNGAELITKIDGNEVDMTATPDFSSMPSDPSEWTMPKKYEYTLKGANSGKIVGPIVNQARDYDYDDDYYIGDYSDMTPETASNPMTQQMNGGLFFNSGEIEGDIYNDGNFYNGVEYAMTVTMPEEGAESQVPTTEVKWSGNNKASIVADTIVNGEYGHYYSFHGMERRGLYNGGKIKADTIENHSVLHNGEINLMYELEYSGSYYDDDEEPIALPETVYFDGAEIEAKTISNTGTIFNAGKITGNVENLGYRSGIYLADGTVDGNVISANRNDRLSIADADSESLYGYVATYNGKNEVTGSVETEGVYALHGSDLTIGGDVNTEVLYAGYPWYFYRWSDMKEFPETNVTLGGALTAKNVLVLDNATLTLGGNAQVDELYTMSIEEGDRMSPKSLEESEGLSLPPSAPSRIDVGTNTLEAGYAVFGEKSILALTVKSEKEFGKVVAGNFEIADGATLEVTVLPGFSKKNTEYELQLLEIDESKEIPMTTDPITLSDDDESSDGDEEETGFNKFTDSFLGEDGNTIKNNMFEIKRVDDNGKYSFTQVRNASELVDGELSKMAAAWVDDDDMTTPASSEVQEELAKIAQNGDAGEFAAALRALAPNNTPVTQAVSSAVSGRVFGNVAAHLSKPKSGLSSGDALNGVDAWGSVYYGKTKLDDRADGVYGFDADSKGVTVGVDKQVTSSVKLGLGLQYDESDVNAFKRDVDVSTTAVFGYGEYRPNNWFVSGIAAYGRSDYDEKKYVGSKTVKANYAADMYAVQGLTGYDFATRYADFTPSAGLRYNYTKRHGYEDGANQKISGSNSDVLTGVVGLKAAKNYGAFRPSVYVNFTYDMVSDREKVSIGLPNGSGYTISGKRLNKFATEAGAALEYNCGDWTFTANYDYVGRKHFNSHMGMLTAKYSF